MNPQNIKIKFKYDYSIKMPPKEIKEKPDIRKMAHIGPFKRKSKFWSKKTLYKIRKPFKLMYDLIFRKNKPKKNTETDKKTEKDNILDKLKIDQLKINVSPINEINYDADAEPENVYIETELIPEDEGDKKYITYLLILEQRYKQELKEAKKARKVDL